MRKHALALLAPLVALVATVALAQEPGKEPVPQENEPPAENNGADASTNAAIAADLPEFSALDANSDTIISREEARGHAGLRAIFAECDADRNGSLNTWEFAEAKNRLDK
jgi:hypothetical protein